MKESSRAWPEAWKAEFEEFLSAEPVPPPPGLSETILSRVHQELSPPFWRLFPKLVAIHGIVGALTLLFCPQFGLGLASGMGLSAIYSRWGAHACMAACGATFVSGSLLAASLLLRPEEVRAIRGTWVLQLSLLTLLSMGVFLFAGAPVAAGPGVFWFFGSVLGGVGALELGWALRRFSWAGI